jgi:hypothetical protein
MDTLVERANDVRLLVLDVDGVLTDGRLYFTARDERPEITATWRPARSRRTMPAPSRT